MSIETEKNLRDQVRQLRAALLSVVYERDGRWYVGVRDDIDVTEGVALAVRMSAPPEGTKERKG